MSRDKRRHPILKSLGLIFLAFLLYFTGKALLWGRWSAQSRTPLPRVELSAEEAFADGILTPEEIAVHYAPEVHAAVNVLISASGKGDFISAVDFDGDWAADNNWEYMASFPLKATVYWSVQETDTHYFVGYCFYHPRDDAEIWLDKHENDFEGIMLCVPRAENAFLPPVCMYTQGHGGVPFYGDGLTAEAGSRLAGGLALDGDRPVIYITPNGTLSHAGHSIESAAGHSLYWSVGDSGIRYYYGGEAQVPLTFKGAYTDNPCSYALEPLSTLWNRRGGPYGPGQTFGEYAAFNGDNYEKNAANPAWGWRNKTEFGYRGSFLSDPAWTFSRAIRELSLSPAYTLNPYADWRLTVTAVSAPEGAEIASLRLLQDGWTLSSPAWWHLTPEGEGRWTVEIAGEARQTLWIAAPAESVWKVEAIDTAENAVNGAEVEWEAVYLD
ncbi:MAG: hypothetical protein IKP40_05650 [Clostridia bacterium]|nr:hypothetical protein [Clostridia bacterium]